MLDFQRRFAAAPPGGRKGAILDGRDIGTVVCPEADAKFFVTASPEAGAFFVGFDFGEIERVDVEQGIHPSAGFVDPSVATGSRVKMTQVI